MLSAWVVCVVCVQRKKMTSFFQFKFGLLQNFFKSATEFETMHIVVLEYWAVTKLI